MHPLVVTLLGGVLIGLSAAWLLLANGRIAGISGILSGLFEQRDESTHWRFLFVIGLLIGGGILAFFQPSRIVVPEGRSLFAIVVAGVLVGFGTRMGSGCTSGHGVCGIGRLSKRSTIATVTFMVTAAITVFIVNEVVGGAV